MYTARFDHARHLLHIRWDRIFSPDEVARYARELQAAFLAHGFRPGYRLLIDMTASAVQPQVTLAAFHEHFDQFPKASRIAIVVPGALARRQVLRIMTQPYLRPFGDVGKALAWLSAPDLPQALSA